MLKLLTRLLKRTSSREVSIHPKSGEQTQRIRPRKVFEGCGHPGPREDFTIRVFGVEVWWKKSPLCPVCTEKRINECSTHCAGCNNPILPGSRVAAAWIDAPHPYTHMSEECGNPDFYDGLWGAGQHIPLSEVHPDIFGAQQRLEHQLFTSE